MNRSVSGSVLILMILSIAQAQDRQKAREVTIIGEVIDSKCYFTQGVGGRGKEHKECALQCARSGIPLAIIEEKTESVYYAAKFRGMGGVNEILLPFVAERIIVKGKLVERGGARLLLIETIERARSIP